MNTAVARQQQRLVRAIEDIRTIVTSTSLGFASPPTETPPTAVRLAKHLWFQEVIEIATIAGMAYRSMVIFQSAQDEMRALFARLGVDHITSESPGGLELSSITSRRFSAAAELQVLIKLIYEWINHLSEITAFDRRIGKAISQPIREKLKEHLHFRNKLATHRRQLRVDTGPASASARAATGWSWASIPIIPGRAVPRPWANSICCLRSVGRFSPLTPRWRTTVTSDATP